MHLFRNWPQLPNHRIYQVFELKCAACHADSRCAVDLAIEAECPKCGTAVSNANFLAPSALIGPSPLSFGGQCFQKVLVADQQRGTLRPDDVTLLKMFKCAWFDEKDYLEFFSRLLQPFCSAF
jgi:hypothetical protein